MRRNSSSFYEEQEKEAEQAETEENLNLNQVNQKEINNLMQQLGDVTEDINGEFSVGLFEKIETALIRLLHKSQKECLNKK